MKKFLAPVLAILALAVISGCSTQPTVNQRDVEALALELRGLGPDVDPEEAERAARVAFAYSSQLRQEYQVTSSPIVHNAKVNNGFRERGLCWHWAEDIERRLNQENFRTLTLHRAISDPENPFRIDHSTAIISRRGDSMYDGVVLDGWRNGGALFWAPTREDTRYNWRPRLDVLKDKERKLYKQRATLTTG
ncbi:hypothetical protein FGK63_10580 [Ruegeria sediminis]|uniref:DUF2786 domain-containing protein n=1 Tax=Ruegeria sediminis TaxID=2583820 RepID=A0ABY2WYH9_9RHOB|nr:hypothetical protein [Ruegeria sediminis]TMV07894.1 hypothetical protein FGK63_10580 [Ruegeria sediminis]